MLIIFLEKIMAKKKTKAERAYKEVRSYVKDKIKLFEKPSFLASKKEITRYQNILEILEEIRRIMDKA